MSGFGMIDDKAQYCAVMNGVRTFSHNFHLFSAKSPIQINDLSVARSFHFIFIFIYFNRVNTFSNYGYLLFYNVPCFKTLTYLIT